MKKIALITNKFRELIKGVSVPSLKSHYRIIIATLSIVGYGAFAVAAPLYNPGQTLTPTCAPGTTGCTVYPMTIGGGVALGTPGSIPFIDANGALQQDNADLHWDPIAHLLSISKGLVIGNVNVVDTISVGTFPSQPIISGNYMYVNNAMSDSVSVIDISTPTSANVVATVTVETGPSYAPTISGDYIYS